MPTTFAILPATKNILAGLNSVSKIVLSGFGKVCDGLETWEIMNF